MSGAERLQEELGRPKPAVVPYLTGGYPDMTSFVGHLDSLTAVAPVVEVGIPFSDPMADGATIQESSRVALANGASVSGILDALDAREDRSNPLVVMSYLNPLVAFGIERLMERLASAGVCGLIVPDLPFEESSLLSEPAKESGIGIVQMVTPLTDPDRMELLCGASEGFVYAVTMTGTTGGEVGAGANVGEYLDRVRRAAAVPVLAGFGVRTRSQVESLSAHCHGVIVGSAIVERITAGRDPAALVEELAG